MRRAGGGAGKSLVITGLSGLRMACGQSVGFGSIAAMFGLLRKVNFFPVLMRICERTSRDQNRAVSSFPCTSSREVAPILA